MRLLLIIALALSTIVRPHVVQQERRNIDPVIFARVRLGMTVREVERILERKPDSSVLLGGSLGDRIDRWNGKHATIVVRFDLGGFVIMKRLDENVE